MDRLLYAGGKMTIAAASNPNRMPFSGVLTYLGVPSDMPPGGSGGLKVLIPVDVGLKAVGSLVGMPVNLDPTLSDHNISKVIGVIEKAWVGEVQANGGSPLHVEGYVFAKNFPGEADVIQKFKDKLGFSYETSNTVLAKSVHNGELVAVAKDLVFTGAAILFKDAAAYKSTSLAASIDPDTAKNLSEDVVDIVAHVLTESEKRDQKGNSKPAGSGNSMTKEVIQVNEEQMKALLAGALGEVTKAVADLTAGVKTIQDEVSVLKTKSDAEEKAKLEAAAEAKKQEEIKAAAEEAAKKLFDEQLKAAGIDPTELQKQIEANKGKEGTNVQAGAASTGTEPGRRSESGLANKFGQKTEVQAAADVFAAIDKKNLPPQQSMAEKLAAVWGN